MSAPIAVWLDFKSPYAWLALDEVRDLAGRRGRALDWQPFEVEIEAMTGGEDAVARAHWQRKDAYLQADVARLAERQGKSIALPAGPVDSRTALRGGLFARDAGVFETYAERVFEGFFAGELALDDASRIAAILRDVGGGEPDLAAAAAGTRLAAQQDLAREAGIFGSPTFELDGEIFWGGDRLAMLARRLDT